MVIFLKTDRDSEAIVRYCSGMLFQLLPPNMPPNISIIPERLGRDYILPFSHPHDKHFWAAAYTQPPVFVSTSLARRTDTQTAVLMSIPCPCQSTYGRPHTSLISDDNLCPRRGDVRDDVKVYVTCSSNTGHPIWKLQYRQGFGRKVTGEIRIFEEEG